MILFKAEQSQVKTVRFCISIFLIVSIGKTGKDVIKLMLNNTSDPLDIVKEKGWLRITDKAQLKLLCNELIEKNLQKVSKNLLLASHALIVVFTT